MGEIGEKMVKEPTVIVNGIGEIIRAIIPLLIIFGFIHWTDQQIAAVILATSVTLGFLGTLFTRSVVTTTETSDKLIRTAVKMPTDTTVEEVKEKANV